MSYIVGTSTRQEFWDRVPHRLVARCGSLAEARAAVDPQRDTDVTQIAALVGDGSIVEIVETYFGHRRHPTPPPIDRPRGFHPDDGSEAKGVRFTESGRIGDDRFSWLN